MLSLCQNEDTWVDLVVLLTSVFWQKFGLIRSYYVIRWGDCKGGTKSSIFRFGPLVVIRFNKCNLAWSFLKAFFVPFLPKLNDSVYYAYHF